jgi:hypothetical protein
MSQLRSGRSLALVVSCSNSKTLPVAPSLMVRNLSRAGDAGDWSRRLDGAPSLVPLRSLYKGAQWQSCVNLAKFAESRSGAPVDLWVISAGLGLRPSHWQAPAYSATFAAGPDCVGATLAERRAWWASLQRTSDGPKVAEVRRRYDEMLIVLSPSYLRVLAPELACMDDEGVAILSSSAGGHPNEVTSEGLQAAVGGADMTLNQRAAQQYLTLAGESPLGGSDTRQRWDAWTAGRRERRDIARQPLGDGGLRDLIHRWRSEGPTSATRLLRRLREDGYACEQGRFARLYAETAGSSR